MNDVRNVKLSSPWVAYWHKIKALLGDDPDIKLEYNDLENKIKVFVNGSAKADALAQLLPAEKEFGNVVVRTIVIPANFQKVDRADLIKDALTGNPNFAFMQKIPGISTNRFAYIVFKKKVAQYWNDNLSDLHGNVSTLYQDLAKEIFGGDDGIMYCTDNAEE